jgi:hypothetical protein
VRRITACLPLLYAIAAAQYNSPEILGTLRLPGLRESSGIVASRAQAGVFWSHNDSGGGPYLYAFDRKGKDLGRWRVSGARATDWEDIAIAPALKGRGWDLYIGDIGDNNARRKDILVYRVAEPDPRAGPATTAPAQAIRLQYPDEPHDAECLMVHPKTRDIYIVTKARGAEEVIVYKSAAPHSLTGPNKLRRIAILDIPKSFITQVVGLITGGDISPDGSRVILCGYFGAWEAKLSPGAKNFDVVWNARWDEVDLGSRTQGEAVCYRHDGRAVLATSEGETSPLIEAVRLRP